MHWYDWSMLGLIIAFIAWVNWTTRGTEIDDDREAGDW